ncbi:hypothetical protein [Burkholderia cepacia]|uniref:hypothetical protein n=1 Tax=Burkholderia cepacia TaxID=292 RepID=UPI00398F5D35
MEVPYHPYLQSAQPRAAHRHRDGTTTQANEPAQHGTDYAAFEGTASIDKQQRFDVEARSHRLAAPIDGFAGSLIVERFRGELARQYVQKVH